MRTYFCTILFFTALISFAQEGIECTTTMEMDSTIESNTTVSYKAGETIVLTDGFIGNSDSDVHLFIEDCGTTSAKNPENNNNLLDSDLSTSEFMVYPNPSNGLFTVQGSDSITAYSISNLMGEQIIFKRNLNLNTINIDISTFASGVYFIEFQKENGGIIKEKIVKN